MTVRYELSTNRMEGALTLDSLWGMGMISYVGDVEILDIYPLSMGAYVEYCVSPSGSGEAMWMSVVLVAKMI